MGLYLREPGEPIFCNYCGKSILGLKILIPKTADGTSVCPKCVESLHLTDVCIPQLGTSLQ